ncbi:MAG: amino acid permease, partial [Solirubrobacterales bacterium]|nr:amino acid permease [Solirubrobacterales bacterium]
MATTEVPQAEPSADSNELAGFGYKQELDRSLGSFSSFAAGFSYISILTGVFELFGFGYLNAGPAVWWSWLVVLSGQMAVALCFAELAGQFPLAGSVYQWSKRISSDAVSWMTGWVLIVGSIVTVAAVAVAWQVVLPQANSFFQILGSKADIGLYSTPGGAKNALLLGAILVIFATVINLLGVKVMARINNFGVAAELIGSTILVILLIFHFHRGPQVVFKTLGTGAGHSWGYFGAFIIGGIMSAYVMCGFDTAGTLAEETNDPRRNAPPAIIRALLAASLIGGLLIIFAIMAVDNIYDKNIGLLGLPYIVKQALGNTAGDVFLYDSAIAITVCTLAVCAACIRMLFAMA